MNDPKHNNDRGPTVVGENAISCSAAPTSLRIAFSPVPKDGTVIDYSIIRKAYDDVPGLLDNWEKTVIDLTQRNLCENEMVANPNPDAIFEFYTDYIVYCIKIQFAQRPRALWNTIASLVADSEKRLKAKDRSARIHKGAPLYNLGLCCFVSGDFDNAYRFFAEAGVEDERSGRGSRLKVLIGDHSLSEQVLIETLQKPLFTKWTGNYHFITNILLDRGEF